jgi:hypothetical protein
MATQRVRANRIELKAYAGTDPATGRRQYLYASVPADAGRREVDRAGRDLDARANELAKGRAARRKDPSAPKPERTPTAKTVAEAVEAWWRGHGAKLASAPKVRSLIDSIIVPEFGAVPVTLLAGTAPDDEEDRDPDLVYLSERWAEVAERRGLMPATIHRAHGILGAALRRAGHPIPDPGLPSIGDRPSTTPLPEEMAAFLPHLGSGRTIGGYTTTRRVRGTTNTVTYTVGAQAEDPVATDVMCRAFALLVASGPRPVATAAITRSQLDGARLGLDGRGVVLTQGPDGRERWVIRGGTTAKRRRLMIGLDSSTLAALERWSRFQDEMCLMLGQRLGPRALVFSLGADASEPISPKLMSDAFGRAVARARQAGVDLPAGFRLYDMRHYGISALLRAGMPVAAVARRFGTSSRMIHSRYEHAIPEDDDRLTATLNGMWGATSG